MPPCNNLNANNPPSNLNPVQDPMSLFYANPNVNPARSIVSFLLHWLVQITTHGLERCSKHWLQRTSRNLLMEESENLIGMIWFTKHGKDGTTVWYFPWLWSLMLGGTCKKDSDARKALLTQNFPLMLGGIFKKRILTSRSGKNFQNSGRLIFLQTKFTFCHSVF